MNVRELIEQLQHLPQDADVHFSYNYGDYWKTTVAPKVESADIGEVVYSDYHRMDRLIDEDSREDEDTRTVVVLGA